MSIIIDTPFSDTTASVIKSGTATVQSGTGSILAEDDSQGAVADEGGNAVLGESAAAEAPVRTPLSNTSVPIEYVIIKFKEVDASVGDQIIAESSEDGAIASEQGQALIDEESEEVASSSSVGGGAVDFTLPPVILAEDSGTIATEDDTGSIGEEGITSPAVALSDTSIFCERVIIYAKSANEGILWLGGYTVTVGYGAPLSITSQPIVLENVDLSEIYIIGDKSGGVTYMYTGAATSESAEANQEVIWVGGSDLILGRGIPITSSSDPLRIDINDLSKVYIIGTIGQSVTFTYAGGDDADVEEEPETFLLNMDGTEFTGMDGNRIREM